MSDIISITKKYNFIREKMPEKKFRYQINSIHNFLLHFDEINCYSAKEFIVNKLAAYLDFIEINEVNSNKECSFLFYEYIAPVGEIYKKHAKFKYFISLKTITIYLIVLNLFLLLINGISYYLILINVIGIVALLMMHFKSKSTRIYRVAW